MVCGKQLFLSNKKLEDGAVSGPVLELLLPIKLFWELEELLKQIDYMNSSSEDPVLIADAYRRVYRKVFKYVVSEKDRLLLQERINAS